MPISCFGCDSFFYSIVMFASMMQLNFPFLNFCSCQSASFESSKCDKVFFFQVWMRQLVSELRQLISESLNWIQSIFSLNPRTVLLVTILSHSHLMVHPKQMERLNKFFLNKWLQTATLYIIHVHIKEIYHFSNFPCDLY